MLRPVADIPDPCKTAWMPVAQPPLPAENPAPIGPEDARFIKETVARFYGPDAVVRSYGPEPRRLKLHVEIRGEPGRERYDCAGVLYARLDREQIAFEVTKRGTAPLLKSRLSRPRAKCSPVHLRLRSSTYRAAGRSASIDCPSHVAKGCDVQPLAQPDSPAPAFNAQSGKLDDPRVSEPGRSGHFPAR